MKDGLSTYQIIASAFSGGTLAVASSEIGAAEIAASSITSAKVAAKGLEQSTFTVVLQSGAYTTDGGEKYTAFASAFGSATPKVLVSPTQAAGVEGPPIVTAVSAGSFAVSGAIAHTGAYIAFGPQA